MEQPIISIIMPALILDQELLDQAQWAIRSLKDLNKDFELIITDDGSKIGSGFLKSEADVYIRNEKNAGFGPACNQAAQKAKGKYLALTCIDVEFLEGSFNDLIDELKDFSVLCPSFKNKGHILERGKVWSNETDGACYIMPIEVYKKLGLYDERYKIGYFEDMDLWKRLRNADHKLGRSGSMVVNHLEGTTQKKLGTRDKYFEENHRKFLEKWGQEERWTG